MTDWKGFMLQQQEIHNYPPCDRVLDGMRTLDYRPLWNLTYSDSLQYSFVGWFLFEHRFYYAFSANGSLFSVALPNRPEQVLASYRADPAALWLSVRSQLERVLPDLVSERSKLRRSKINPT